MKHLTQLLNFKKAFKAAQEHHNFHHRMGHPDYPQPIATKGNSNGGLRVQQPNAESKGRSGSMGRSE
jgi:hypothetical protein